MSLNYSVTNRFQLPPQILRQYFFINYIIFDFNFYVKNLTQRKLSQKELFSTCHENSRYIRRLQLIHEKLYLFSTNKQRRPRIIIKKKRFSSYCKTYHR